MCRILVLLTLMFTAKSQALEVEDVKTAGDVQQVVTERIEQIRKTKKLETKKKLADQLVRDCLRMEQDTTIEATAACYVGLGCLGTSYLKFDLSQCKTYISDCEYFFLGGIGRGENVKITAYKGSSEAYGFQLLSAMGRQVPAEYLHNREPSSEKEKPKPKAKKEV